MKEVTKYLNIGIPSFTGTYNATLPEEEIAMLLEKNGELIQKIEVFLGDPSPEGQDDDSTCPDNYIIVDTNSDPSEDDFIDEAGADIMESSTDQNF